jgi:hypothetical protein
MTNHIKPNQTYYTSDYTELISDANKVHTELEQFIEAPQVLEFAGIVSICLVSLVYFTLISHKLILYTVHLDSVSIYYFLYLYLLLYSNIY